MNKSKKKKVGSKKPQDKIFLETIHRHTNEDEKELILGETFPERKYRPKK